MVHVRARFFIFVQEKVSRRVESTGVDVEGMSQLICKVWKCGIQKVEDVSDNVQGLEARYSEMKDVQTNAQGGAVFRK